MINKGERRPVASQGPPPSVSQAARGSEAVGAREVGAVSGAHSGGRESLSEAPATDPPRAD